MQGSTLRRLIALLLVLGAGMTMGSDRARAGDAHLDASTILLLSFDDWSAMSSEAKASDFGRFMKDPEIKGIMTRLQPAFVEMMKSMMAEELESGPASSLPGGEKMAEIGERLMGAAMSIGGRMCENMTGRTAISISLLLDPTAPLPMNLIFEFGGGEEIQKAVDEMFSLLEKESEGEMKARTIEIEGQKGRCIESDGAGSSWFGAGSGSPPGSMRRVCALTSSRWRRARSDSETSRSTRRRWARSARDG
jgi:hypothetical protein